MRVTATAIAFGLLASCSGAAVAQGFPNRPVRFIVPFPPGGGTDAFARVVGAKLSEDWGQQVLVENRPGAQGSIGTAVGARAAPDGHTITLAYVGTLAINPHLYKQPGYDALNDFAAITRGTEEAWILVVHPSVPARTAKELAALAKVRANRLSFASSASGTQMVGELYKAISGTQILHVPYKGAGPAVTAVLGGEVTMLFANIMTGLPLARSGRMRGLAVTSDARTPIAPDVPTVAEAGVPGYAFVTWFGVLAPGGTPAPIVERLNTAFRQAIVSPDIANVLVADGVQAQDGAPDVFAQVIRSDIQRFTKLARQVGMTVD